MFDFGITNYRPHWLRGADALSSEHADRLAALIGRGLTRAAVVWDRHEDEWFRDCPVVLDFDGEQVEINHQKFDDLSITWNTIDLHGPVVWPVPGFVLAWRYDVPTRLHALAGQVLDDVALLEWTGEDMARGAVSVGFSFGRGRLAVFNALDENGLEFGPPDPRHRRHPMR